MHLGSGVGRLSCVLAPASPTLKEKQMYYKTHLRCCAGPKAIQDCTLRLASECCLEQFKEYPLYYSGGCSEAYRDHARLLWASESLLDATERISGDVLELRSSFHNGFGTTVIKNAGSKSGVREYGPVFIDSSNHRVQSDLIGHLV